MSPLEFYMEERCFYCGQMIGQQEYRHRFPIHLPEERHGDTIVVAPRTIQVSVHPVCAVACGRELVHQGMAMLAPEQARQDFTQNLDNWLKTL